jgi:prolyl-tRNA synthetase
MECGEPLRLIRGVEVGNIFKLGTRYTSALGATFLDEGGVSNDIIMASYGIGVDRLIGCVAERNRDERGLIWPVSIAPYHVYLVGLDLGQEDVRETAECLYNDLEAAGVEVLFDDRTERAGVKFNDADLLGIPIRVTVSRRTVDGRQAELKLRTVEAPSLVPASDVTAEIERVLGEAGAAAFS